MTTSIATQESPAMAQRGRLSLSRYVGESVLIYPKHQHAHLPVAALFSVPVTIQLEQVQVEGGSAHFKITADKRLVVVRNEIFKRNNQFQPQSTWTDDALRRAFYDMARDYLDERTFNVLNQKAQERIG